MSEREREMCRRLVDALEGAATSWEWARCDLEPDGTLLIQDADGRVFRLTVSEVAE